jgi:hypothetical protein
MIWCQQAVEKKDSRKTQKIDDGIDAQKQVLAVSPQKSRPAFSEAPIVDSDSADGSDLFGLGGRAIILVGHLLDSVVRNSEIRRGAFGLPIPAKIPAEWTAAVVFCIGFSIRRDSFAGKSGTELAT